MTPTMTPTEDRALYGCPSWCNFDHAGEIYVDPGEHTRALAQLASGGSVSLCRQPRPATRGVLLPQRRRPKRYPVTRETVEHLRDVARMLREASDELSGMLQSGELGLIPQADAPAV